MSFRRFRVLWYWSQKKDYERFDIKASKDSLKNAALASKGAVPEPHEWAMIIIAISLLLYVRRKSFDPSI